MSAGERLLVSLGSGRLTSAYGDEHVDVDRPGWVEALRVARDELGCRWLDWLGAYEDGRPGESEVSPVVVVRLWSVERREAVLLRTGSRR